MADDQLDVKEGEEQPVEPSATEEPTGEVEQPVEEEASESTEEPTETVEGKGANQRIRELNQKAKAAEAKAKSLEDLVAELRGSDEPGGQDGYQPQQPYYNPQEPFARPGEELDPNEFERRLQAREQRMEARIELKNRQNEALSRHRNEVAEVMNTYKQLNPGTEDNPNPDFDPDLSESVTEAVWAHLKTNPYTGSAKKFAEKLMKPYTRAVANEVGKERENIARQVSQSALRPTSVRKSEKTASEKSLAELEAELGIVNS